MPNFREYGRSLICLVTGASLIYQVEVVSAQDSTSRWENRAQKAVGALGKVAKLFSAEKNASDALELRDAKLAGQATKEQMDRGVSAVSNLGKDASAAVAVASGGTLYSITNAAVASHLIAIAKSEGDILNRQSQAAQDAILARTPSEMTAALERLERVRIEAAHFEPDMGSFWDAAKDMASALGGGTKNASLAFLKMSVTEIGGMVSDFTDKETSPKSISEQNKVKTSNDNKSPINFVEDVAKKSVSDGNFTTQKVEESSKYEKPLSGAETPNQATLGNEDYDQNTVESEEDNQPENDFSTEDAASSKTLSYEWDEKSGTNVWKVDGEIVDSSNEEVQRFCADPSKNCPVQGTGSESAQPGVDIDGATPTTETEVELASPVTNPVEESPSQNTASADSEAIGGMQSAGGNPVVTPGNSIWHGEGGFQGEEYDDNGLNGTSNIKQFKLWDSDDLAPQASSDVQQKAVTTERVIDEPVPRGSVYMPDEKYMADPNSEYGNHSADSNSSNFSPSKDVAKKKNTARSSRKNRNNTGRPRNTGCGPGMHAADYSTPFPKSCF